MNPAVSLFVSLASGAAVVLVGFFLLGLHRRERAANGSTVDSLNRLKWREFAACAGQMFRQRGYELANRNRHPGEGGFDLLLERDGKRYVVQLKEGGTYQVGGHNVDELRQIMQTQGAKGAFLLTTGKVRVAVANAARSEQIEIISGDALWKEIKPFVPHTLTDEDDTGAQEQWRTRMLSLAAFGVLVALALFIGAYFFVPRGSPSAAVRPAPDPAATAAAAADAEEDAAAAARAKHAAGAMPEEEQALRRRHAADLIGEIEGVIAVSWSTKSTLVVGINGSTPEARRQVIGQVCGKLAAFEELKLSRLQVHEMEADYSTDLHVRYQQCR